MFKRYYHDHTTDVAQHGGAHCIPVFLGCFLRFVICLNHGATKNEFKEQGFEKSILHKIPGHCGLLARYNLPDLLLLPILVILLLPSMVVLEFTRRHKVIIYATPRQSRRCRVIIRPFDSIGVHAQEQKP